MFSEYEVQISDTYNRLSRCASNMKEVHNISKQQDVDKSEKMQFCFHLFRSCLERYSTTLCELSSSDNYLKIELL